MPNSANSKCSGLPSPDVHTGTSSPARVNALTISRALGGLLPVLVALPAAGQERRTPPREADNAQLIATTAEAAVGCAVAAGPDGVDAQRFAGSDEWIAEAQPPGYRHRTLPIVISLLPDGDGIVRRCVVNSTLASQNDQDQLALALQVLIPQQPVDHDGGMIWRFGRSPSGRSLHMVRDPANARPQILFVGAAF